MNLLQSQSAIADDPSKIDVTAAVSQVERRQATRGTNSLFTQPILVKSRRKRSPKYHEVGLKDILCVPA